MKIILASRSPRRKELLAASGMSFISCDCDVDEIAYPRRPALTTRINAEKKAAAAALLYPDSLIISSDTVVFLDVILGKPENLNQAYEMLMSLRGKTHMVYTAVTVRIPPEKKPISRISTARVTMKRFPPGTIEEYCRRVDPLDKAGGYAIQEEGEMLIESFSGSISTVIGLPLEALEEILDFYPDTRQYVAGIRAART